MELIVGVGAQGVTLADPGNLKALAVRLPDDVDDVAADGALRRSGLGSVQDGHAWLDPAALGRTASAAGVGPGWADDFSAMLEFARSRGWWRAADGAVRAHLERSDGADVTSTGPAPR